MGNAVSKSPRPQQLEMRVLRPEAVTEESLQQQPQRRNVHTQSTPEASLGTPANRSCGKSTWTEANALKFSQDERALLEDEDFLRLQYTRLRERELLYRYGDLCGGNVHSATETSNTTGSETLSVQYWTMIDTRLEKEDKMKWLVSCCCVYRHKGVAYGCRECILGHHRTRIALESICNDDDALYEHARHAIRLYANHNGRVADIGFNMWTPGFSPFFVASALHADRVELERMCPTRWTAQHKDRIRSTIDRLKERWFTLVDPLKPGLWWPTREFYPDVGYREDQLERFAPWDNAWACELSGLLAMFIMFLTTRRAPRSNSILGHTLLPYAPPSP
jgi:hypothetical protein